MFPVHLADGPILDVDRRLNAHDRRRNAFISQQLLCKRIPYHLVETLLADCASRTLEPSDTLLSCGDENHSIFLLTQGQLQVCFDAQDVCYGIPVNVGESVGEMSVVDGKPVDADVIAVQRSEVLVIPEGLFWAKIAPLPGVFRNLLQLLTTRLRQQNDKALHALADQLRLEHLEQQLEIAAEIQAGLLPPSPLFPQYPEVDAFAKTVPVWGVGGDFYEAFPLDGQRLCVAVGDVSGKGVPAALFMTQAMKLLRMAVQQRDSLVGAITHLNWVLHQNNPAGMFLSLFIGVLEITSGQFNYINCGHHPPLLASSGKPSEALPLGDNLFVGAVEEAVFTENTVLLYPGDSLILYSDGVVEAANSDGAFFTINRLQTVHDRHRRNSAEEMVSSTWNALRDFTGGSHQQDDVTLMAVRYLGSADSFY
jgi:phosphoserine phosphatase RsbU/P